VSRHRYMPFGEELPVQAQNSTNTRQFTGHERDGENGLDYMMARYYSASLDRFMAVDPVGGSVENPQSWNRYGYVRNNPLAFIDPRGTNPMPRPYNVPPWEWGDPCAGMQVCSEAGGNTGSGGDSGSSGGSGDSGQTSGGSSTGGGEAGTEGGEWVPIGVLPGPGGRLIYVNSSTGERRISGDMRSGGPKDYCASCEALNDTAIVAGAIWMTAVATVTVVAAAPEAAASVSRIARNPTVRMNLADMGFELSEGWRNGRNLDYLGNPTTGSWGGWLGYWGAFYAGAATRLSPLRNLFPGN